VLVRFRLRRDDLVLTLPGGLIVLDHVICESPLDSSIECFQKLSERIFPRKSYRCCEMLYNIIDWFAWWLSDNKYDSDILEDVVQEVFGVRQHLFDVDSQHRTGIKVAITATTVSTCLLRIFTNYNGADRRRQGRGESWANSQSCPSNCFQVMPPYVPQTLQESPTYGKCKFP